MSKKYSKYASYRDDEYNLYILEEACFDPEALDNDRCLELNEDFLVRYQEAFKIVMDMQTQISRLICKQLPDECPIVNYRPDDE